MSKTIKVTIPVVIDDVGFVCWEGNNWETNEDVNISASASNALKACRARPPSFTREDRVVLVEVEIPLVAAATLSGKVE